MNKEKIILASIRVSLGFIFLWAFFDKLFGLGFATVAEKAWVNGGSPTFGFLMFATRGPLTDFYHSLAGNPYIDWLFMIGLLFVGITLFINKYVKWGSIAGIAMLLLMYTAVLLPENNPIIDDHIVYILVLSYIAIRAEKEEQSNSNLKSK